eukprot:15343193-Ditylum_brightwellii.AAC.1
MELSLVYLCFVGETQNQIERGGMQEKETTTEGATKLDGRIDMRLERTKKKNTRKNEVAKSKET